MTRAALDSNNASGSKRELPSLNLRQLRPAPLGATFSMATAQSSAAPHCPPRRRASARRPGHQLHLAQAALAARHRSHRRFSAGAPALELRGAERPGRLRRAGEVSQQPAPGARAGVGLHLPADPLSRHLWRLDLAARQIEHRLLPVGRELDVPCRSATPASLPSPTSSSMCCASASWASCCLRIPAPLSRRCSMSSRIPGCWPSTSSP